MTPTADALPDLAPATLGDPEAIRARAAEGRAMRTPEPADQYDGAEATRSVWVSVDPRCRLLSVDISATWRQRLAVDDFAGAVFDAYTSAVRTALVAEDARYAPRTPRQAEPVPLNSGQDLETWLAAGREWLAATDERLAGLDDAATRFANADDDVREVSGPAGYVTLRLRGGALTGITASTAGLKSANPNLLRRDVLDAFRAAGLGN